MEAATLTANGQWGKLGPALTSFDRGEWNPINQNGIRTQLTKLSKENSVKNKVAFTWVIVLPSAAARKDKNGKGASSPSTRDQKMPFPTHLSVEEWEGLRREGSFRNQ